MNIQEELNKIELEKQLLDLKEKNLLLQEQNRILNKLGSLEQKDEVKHLTNLISDTKANTTTETKTNATETKSLVKESEPPQYTHLVTMADLTKSVGLKSNSSAKVTKFLDDNNIKRLPKHGRYYYHISIKDFVMQYNEFMGGKSRPLTIQKLPDNYYSLNEIGSWFNLKGTYDLLKRVFDKGAREFKRLTYKGNIYFLIEDKQSAINKHKELRAQFLKAKSENAKKHLHAYKENSREGFFSLTQIINQLNCGRSLATQFVEWLNFDEDKKVPVHHETGRVKMYFYKFTTTELEFKYSEFMKSKHSIEGSYEDFFEPKNNAEQSTLALEHSNISSIFSETYPWIVYGNRINMVLPNFALDNVDSLDHNCTITFTKDSQPLSVKISSLDKSCQQAILNYIDNQ